MNRNSFWIQQAPATIAGVLILGIIGSTLYDLLVKPGLTSFGQFTLNLFTLGSKTLRDSAYAAAAMDPTPISGLVILLALVLAATYPALKMAVDQRGERRERELDAAIERAVTEGPEKIEAQIAIMRRRIAKLKALFFVIYIPWIAAIYLAFSWQNQSVLIWRVFNTNIAILTPFISSDEKARLVSRFSSMNTKAEYEEIRKTLTELSKAHNIKIREENTW